MEENNKYYTPTIEEFHIGFEYQRLINNKWVDETYDPWDDFLAGDVLFCISEQSLRVKYLDKTDIESLGFVQSKLPWQFYKEDSDFYFYIPEPSKDFEILGNNHICISSKRYGDVVFRGIIKNKSELKRLMKQLGIYE